MDILELSGTSVKSYEILRLLGKGGYGVVYLARQSAVMRDVAVKVILPKYANSPEFIRRFESEAQVVAHLEHPHIVPLYDYWREPDSAYLVMRYLRGGSLRDIMETSGKLDPEVVGKVLEQVGAALTFAHNQGVVHRDIKADNVFLDNEGNAYLGDFGIAKQEDTEEITQQGQVVGTLAYLSPEQILRGEAGPSSDIYALGIMLYEMLSGTRPFAGETLATLVRRHLNDPLPLIDHIDLSFPQEINAIIQRATAKTPRDRYPDVRSMVADYHQALRSGAVGIELELEELDFAEFELLETKNPYKGLRAFQQADAADFFGRKGMIANVVDRLQEDRDDSNFLAVIGPSGSGKSSLVKAGVLPALRSGAIPGSENWFYAEMVPGEVPVEELASALLSVSSSPLPGVVDTLREREDGLEIGCYEALPSRDSKLLLMIDQFEELFTQVESERDRQQFLDLILHTVEREDSPIIIIATLRADFYDRPLLYQRFGELIRVRTELVLPLNDEELAEAISGPSFRVGAVLEEGLVDTIINDVREQPGALPLLQYALTELFERRNGALLTVAAYQEIGGTLGALAKRAEEVYRRFNEAGQMMAQQIFLRLVTLGEGQEDTRRRIFQSELMTLGDSEVAQYVLDRFGRYRLLTFDRDETTRGSTVEVAHEALIRRWERLREWLEESRQDVRRERNLLHAAENWQRAKGDSSYLLQGTRLNMFEEWQESTSLVLNQLEKDFMQASLSARAERERQERERQERERQQELLLARRTRIAAIVFAGAAVVAVLLSILAFDQRNRAEEARMVADEQRIIADDQRVQAEAARQVADEQRGIAETEREEAEAARQVADEQRERAEAARQVAEDKTRKNLSLALAANARNALGQDNPSLALPVAIEARQAFDPPQAEVLRILGLAAFAPGPRYLFPSEQSILAVASDADGGVAAYAGSDGFIRLFNAAGGMSVLLIEAGSPVTGLDISPDVRWIAASLADGSVGLWDMHTGERRYSLQGHSKLVSDVEFSPDGRLLASSSADSTVRIWDVTTGQERHVLQAHIDYVIKVSFHPDGGILASASAAIGVNESERGQEHNTIRLWDIVSGENVLTIPPDGIGFIRDVEFSPDGEHIAATTWSGALGGTARIYDAASGAELQRLYAHRDTIADLEYAPDGSSLATASTDASVKIWDLEKGVLVASYVDLGQRVRDIEYLPDGEQMLIGLGNAGNFPDGSDSAPGSAAYLWDLRNRTQERVYHGHKNWTWAADISPSGGLIASGSGPLSLPASPADLDATVRIWDTETGIKIITLLGHENTVDSVRFLPDGRQLLSASWDGSIRRWDLLSGAELQRYTIDDARVYMIDLLPGGERFVSASSDGIIRLWDIDAGTVLREYPGHSAPVNGVHVSADGKRMVSAAGSFGGEDPTIRLWDIETGEQLQVYEGHGALVNYAQIAPNGEFIISTSWDDTVRMWDLETGEEIRQFIGHAGNTFGIDISGDSQYLLTTSSDTTVRLWHIPSAEELLRYDQHGDWVQEVLFSADERFAVSAGQDFSLRRWTVARSADDMIGWAQENRSIRDLTCAERRSYSLDC